MMMQMLQRGGMPIATDGRRTADMDNPRGYLELDDVRRLHGKDPRPLLAALVGKTVKIVQPLLYQIPIDVACRVIIMRRNLDEVLASQRIMLTRREHLALDDTPLREAFERELRRSEQWLTSRRAPPALIVNYEEVVRVPLREAERVSAFLDGGLDSVYMAAAVDASLHRQRSL